VLACFSEIKNGVHMALMTATDSRSESRSESRNVYMPRENKTLSLVKTSRTRRMNDLQTSLMRRISIRFWP
jgi:hypothetical protein